MKANIRIFFSVLTSIILCLFLTPINAKSQEFSDAERKRNEIYESNKNALVLIENLSRDIQGTGLIYSNNGEIITNYHVIHDAKKLRIWVMRREPFTEVYIQVVDTDRDLAILKIDAKELDTVQLARLDKTSNREYPNVPVGMDILALGNPQTMPHSLTKGVISSVRKSEETPGVDFHEGYEVFQMDAQTGKGSSGGALFNMQGKVIGITVASLAPGFNFAIPVNYARNLIRNAAAKSEGIRSEEYDFPDLSFDSYYLQCFNTRQKKPIFEYIMVTGNVLDNETHRPLQFVKVSIIGMSSFDSTDINGLFALDVLQTSKSPISLNVLAPGYKIQQQKVDLENLPGSLQLFLEPQSGIRHKVGWLLSSTGIVSGAGAALSYYYYREAQDNWRTARTTQESDRYDKQRKIRGTVAGLLTTVAIITGGTGLYLLLTEGKPPPAIFPEIAYRDIPGDEYLTLRVSWSF